MVEMNKKHRDSNLELFRVLVMLSIIAHHYVVNSGVWNAIQADGPTMNSLGGQGLALKSPIRPVPPTTN